MHHNATGTAQPVPPAEPYLKIKPFDGLVTVRYADAVIASSENALVLQEGDRDPVYYLPFKDIYFERLQKSDTTSTCPHKGLASYWSVYAVGENVQDAMWAYEAPNAEASALAGHGAFHPDRVKVDAGPKEDKPLPIG